MEERCIPNRFGRFLLLALERTLGTPGFHAVVGRAGLRHLAVCPPDNLERGFPVGYVPRLMTALEEMYGVGKGRELAFQTGRTSFRLGIPGFGVLMDLAGLLFPLLPTRTRARMGLETLAEMLNRFADGRIQVRDQDRHLVWVIEHCGICGGRTATSPCCHLLTGLLQETVHWATGRDAATVTEVVCAAAGGPHCAMEIELG